MKPKVMRTKIFLFALILCSFLSCEKEDTNRMRLKGRISDAYTNKPLSNVKISIDAIKSSSGMGIITGGKRMRIANFVTNENGDYDVKLKVFDGAENFYFYINAGSEKAGYVYIEDYIAISEIKNSKVDFSLNPTALLKINYKSINPFDEKDSFTFHWNSLSEGFARGIVTEDYCGTVRQGTNYYWIGKDVCGSRLIETIAEVSVRIGWKGNKNGVDFNNEGKVIAKIGVITEFNIFY